jgi:hypothetical protein
VPVASKGSERGDHAKVDVLWISFSFMMDREKVGCGCFPTFALRVTLGDPALNSIMSSFPIWLVNWRVTRDPRNRTRLNAQITTHGSTPSTSTSVFILHRRLTSSSLDSMILVLTSIPMPFRKTPKPGVIHLVASYPPKDK